MSWRRSGSKHRTSACLTPRRESVGHLDFLDAVLAIHVSAILGLLLNEGIASLGLELPLFV